MMPGRRAARSAEPAAKFLTALTLAPTALAETLINAMEAKNAYLRGHSQRVADLAASTAEALGLAADLVEQVRLAGKLHDLGKIGIREAVLDKPDRLDPDEYAHVKDHVRIGLEILAPMAQLGPVLDFIADHHERLDGSGYPRGVGGDEISVGGRIIAAADTFDALTSRRAYRDSRTEDDTLAYMSGLVGTSLFPDVFDALRQVVEQRQSLVFLGEMRAPGEHLERSGHPKVRTGREASATGRIPAGQDLDAIRGLVTAFAALSSAERLALTLQYLERLSDAEIEHVVATDPAAAESLRRNARRCIAKVG
jgi:putative nucleotidyltransferase with HDIG domain